MKRLVRSNNVFAMANLSPKLTGLNCVIWVDSMGSSRSVQHSVPQVKVEKDGFEISVSIEPRPRVLAKSTNTPHSVIKEFRKAVKYVATNYDLFIKHYNDSGFSYSDSDLMFDLRDRRSSQ